MGCSAWPPPLMGTPQSTKAQRIAEFKPWACISMGVPADAGQGENVVCGGQRLVPSDGVAGKTRGG